MTVLDRHGHMLQGTAELVNDALDKLADNARRDRPRDGRAMEDPAFIRAASPSGT